MKVNHFQSLAMAVILAVGGSAFSHLAQAAAGAGADGKIQFTPRELNSCESVRSRFNSSAKHAVYNRAFPIHVEICGASTWQKRGASDGGNYGHAFGLIKGACLVRDASGAPVVPQQLKRCAVGEVGVSSDYIFFNTQWVATEGRNFMLYGNHNPGEPLDRAAWMKIQDEAHKRGVFTGVDYQKTYRQEILAKAQKEGISEQQARILWEGDASLGTDFAVAAARGGVDCTRIPIMGTKPGKEYKVLDDIIEHLNRKNRETYEASRTIPPGKTEPVGFDYDGTVNNCTTNFYNALAAVDYWTEKDTSGHPVGTLDVLMRIKDAAAPYDVIFGAYKMGNILDINFLVNRYRKNPKAFAYFKETGWMGAQSGTLIDPIPALEYMNSIYDTTNLTHFATIGRELQLSAQRLVNKLVSWKMPIYEPDLTEFNSVRQAELNTPNSLLENLKKWYVLYARAVAELSGRRDQDEVVKEMKVYFQKKLEETQYLLAYSEELKPTVAPACTGH